MLDPAERLNFLKHAGWAGAFETRVGEDWSQRKIFRVEKNGRSAIVMHSLPDDHPQATAGHKLRDFVRISSYLFSIGLSAPQVYAQDVAHGLLLVEDFGSISLQDRIQDMPSSQGDDYLRATNVLAHIYGRSQHISIDLPDYYAGHIHTGRRRVVDWYIPAIKRVKNPDGLSEEYLEVWKKIEKSLPIVPRRFLHADFHPANLMWLAEREKDKQIGLVDFQGAVVGPAPYDLVNLLDDARRIVPDDIRAVCLGKFIEHLMPAERESFLAWYPILACQFHCRVIGQAVKLAVHSGKTRLLDLVPILSHHLQHDLKHPLLAPLAQWFVAQRVDFRETATIDLSGLGSLIREDAF